jgi:diaminohydroxyphosphoribosylaminopyrimidine deaminase/5-amino-6-(5-phosphoribosylamino)uracil reductase
LIEKSALYVSLEPCSHYGKTPPCTDLIIKNKIKKVVVSVLDPNPLVAGKGIRKLEAANIEVIQNVLNKEGKMLMEDYIFFHQNKMPFITLKFAQSADGFIGQENKQIAVSNELSKRFVHQLRAENQAILIGNNTLQIDNPMLNVRYANGKNPVKIVLCRNGNVDAQQNIFKDKNTPIIIINEIKNETSGNVSWLKINDIYNLDAILKKLYEQNIQSVLVEGGAKILSSFIEQKKWNRIIQIKAPILLKSGIAAPSVDEEVKETFFLGKDIILIFAKKSFAVIFLLSGFFVLFGT